ncbi:hypothetical protein PN466_15010 [Roseofilum reptotaenium CS-1145]|uniref:Uncharacterized protein n=1 Tax=Roseofilum reptotaenium AO1-A TaxID=1925591 RepID=A0A1L9QSB0_9CYAN|nr:hypothetical protein [Roseofilum reptotaenium]MDB9518255.1 hypothetical protein [Roseofilum reptotaenium CS-1145]OJJ25539.1 hypothetical protein BI308_11285 [Roseofilum reptotaenium AO1-A]
MILKKFLIDSLLFSLLAIPFQYLFFILSGWRGLAKHYKARKPDSMVLSRWEDGSVGSMSLYSILNVGICDEGLFLSLTPPIYPSLFIPWEDITEVSSSSFGDPRLDKYKLYIGNPHITIISLRKETLKPARKILLTKFSNYETWWEYLL